MRTIILTLLILTSVCSYACECFQRIIKGKSNIEVAIQDFNWIGVIVVSSVDSTKYPLEYDFETLKIYQGNEQKSLIQSGYGGGDCGFGFEIGETYLVYGIQENNQFIKVNICSRTAKINESADTEYLTKHLGNPDYQFHWSTVFTNYIETKTQSHIDIKSPPLIVSDYKCISIEQLIDADSKLYEFEIITLNSKELKQINPELREIIKDNKILVKKKSFEKIKRKKLVRELNKNCA